MSRHVALRVAHGLTLVAALATCSSQPQAPRPQPRARPTASAPSAPMASVVVVDGPASAAPQALPSAAPSAAPPDPKGPIAIGGPASAPEKLVIDGDLTEWGEIPTSSVVPVLTARGLVLAGRVAAATDRGVLIGFDASPRNTNDQMCALVYPSGACIGLVKDFDDEHSASYVVSSTGIMRAGDKARPVKDAKVVWKNDGGGIVSFEARIPPAALPLFACPSEAGSLWAARFVSADHVLAVGEAPSGSVDSEGVLMHPTDPLRAGGCHGYRPGGYQPGTGNPWVILQVRGNQVVRGTAPLVTQEEKCGDMEIVRVFPELIAARFQDGTLGDTEPAGKVLGCVPAPPGPVPPGVFVMAYHAAGEDQTPGYEVYAISAKGEIFPVGIEFAPVSWWTVSPFHDSTWKTFGMSGIAQIETEKKALRLTWTWDVATSSYKLVGTGAGP